MNKVKESLIYEFLTQSRKDAKIFHLFFLAFLCAFASLRQIVIINPTFLEAQVSRISNWNCSKEWLASIIRLGVIL